MDSLVKSKFNGFKFSPFQYTNYFIPLLAPPRVVSVGWTNEYSNDKSLNDKDKGLVPAEDFALQIVKVVAKDVPGIFYIPRTWKVIMFVVQHIPVCLFNRFSKI